MAGQRRARNKKNIEVKSTGLHTKFYTEEVGRQKTRKSQRLAKM